jgi:hypothetical protein
MPYLLIAGYDGWLHEKARKVPMAEQVSHAIMAVCVAVLVWSVFFDHPQVITPVLIVFAITALTDELGFHGQLHRHEKYLHYFGYASFAGFAAFASFAAFSPLSQP